MSVKNSWSLDVNLATLLYINVATDIETTHQKMNKLMLVILIVTTFYVTISVSSPIISDNEEATDQGE